MLQTDEIYINITPFSIERFNGTSLRGFFRGKSRSVKNECHIRTDSLIFFEY